MVPQPVDATEVREVADIESDRIAHHRDEPHLAGERLQKWQHDDVAVRAVTHAAMRRDRARSRSGPKRLRLGVVRARNRELPTRRLERAQDACGCRLRCTQHHNQLGANLNLLFQAL